MVSQVNRPVKPRVSTTSRTSDQRVERTDRIFVHSDSSRRPNPVTPDTAGVREPPGRVACTGGLAEVTRSSPESWPAPARYSLAAPLVPVARRLGLHIRGCPQSAPCTPPPARRAAG